MPRPFNRIGSLTKPFTAAGVLGTPTFDSAGSTEDGVAELVPVRHFLGVVFRVDGKRHHLGPDPFQPLDMLLKIG